MSLVDAGVGRTYIRWGGNSNLAHSNIEHHGGTGGKAEGSVVVSLGKTEIEPRRSRQP